MTPFGVEPTTFRFVAQFLNHCATAVPYKNLIILGYYAVQEGLLGLLDSYQSTQQNILDDLAVLTNWLSELTKDRAVILE
jgi:hypothetical protein